MSEREGRPVRRLRSVQPHDQAETPASILPGSPRVGALDALLREVDGLRLTLETDLSLAASAVEAGSPGLAMDILESDRTGLARFEDRALGHLASLSAAHPVRRRRVRVPAVPFVAAAALVGFLVGVVPSTVSSGTDAVQVSTVAANSSLDQLKAFAAEGNTDQVRITAFTLHQQLLAVVARAGSDPAAAERALFMLSIERNAIEASGDSVALREILVRSADLAKRIRNALPSALRSGVPAAPALELPRTASPTPKPTTASSKPTPSPTASPSASPTPSPTPSPSGSPKSSSSAQPGVVPTGSPAGGG